MLNILLKTKLPEAYCILLAIWPVFLLWLMFMIVCWLTNSLN